MVSTPMPANGRTSDGMAVAIAKVDPGFLTQIAGWDRFLEAGNAALQPHGLSLPSDYRTARAGTNARVWRTAPDRALVRSDAPLDLAGSDDLAVLDLSDARVVLMLKGDGAAGLLGRAIALDFSEAGFPVGIFAQTSLHHVGVLLERAAQDEFTLMIPTTWASSVTGFLADHL
jgi:methylglutamate dehydrogenase subunit D